MEESRQLELTSTTLLVTLLPFNCMLPLMVTLSEVVDVFNPCKNGFHTVGLWQHLFPTTRAFTVGVRDVKESDWRETDPQLLMHPVVTMPLVNYV